MKIIIKQILSDSGFGCELNIQTETKSMKSLLTTSNVKHFNELNKLLGFTNT